VLIDGLFAIDREAREQKPALHDRHAEREERAPAIPAKSAAGQAISQTLNRWEKPPRNSQSALSS
jgi:hypothetical protein